MNAQDARTIGELARRRERRSKQDLWLIDRFLFTHRHLGRPGSEQLGSGSAKKTKSKEKGGGKKGAAQSVPAKVGPVFSNERKNSKLLSIISCVWQMDASKPHWTLRVVTKNEVLVAIRSIS